MIVNLPLCTCMQGWGLWLNSLPRECMGQVGWWICQSGLWGFRIEPVWSLLLAITAHLLCLFLPRRSSWQKPRVPRIGFWGIFLVLYQTCRLPSAVLRLQFREGALDWQALALAVPGEKGRGICDGCTDSYFSYNFLQAGFRLSGWKKALSA